MSKWNTTGKTKAILCVLLSLLVLVSPAPPFNEGVRLADVVFPLIFGLFVIPLIMKGISNFNITIEKPQWNSNPLILTKPLNFFHFAAFFMLIAGVSLNLGTLIKFHEITSVGVMSISYGAGILGGIWIFLKYLNGRKS